ncbi:hypothetical protein B0H13DRAFT_2650151 [Mycena leptocephala]|nr:hypothetical protein B0H13DRAFT_2650151 [Mycena leptocephala]
MNHPYRPWRPFFNGSYGSDPCRNRAVECLGKWPTERARHPWRGCRGTVPTGTGGSPTWASDSAPPFLHPSFPPYSMAGSDVKDTTQAEKRGRGRPKGSKTKKGLPGTRSSTRRRNDGGPPKPGEDKLKEQRARKRKRSEEDESAREDQSAAEDQLKEQPAAAPQKKRGRPSNDARPADAAAKKKRGRPSK